MILFLLMEAHPASCTRDSGTFWGVNCLEHGAHHPPSFTAGLQMCQSYSSVSPFEKRNNASYDFWESLSFNLS